MADFHPTALTTSGKPSKPYPEFPLTPHPVGQWCKKIRGKLHYFGPWDDPEGALARYNAQKDDLHAGRTPRPDADAVTVGYLCNRFLAHKEALLNAGELSPRSWDDYKGTCKIIAAAFGKNRLAADLRPDDFAALRKKLARSVGQFRLGNEIQRTRGVFKFGYEAELLDSPLRFGPGFKRPSQKTLRIHRAEKGKKLFTADEVRRMIDPTGPALHAMLLLGINCGMGNADCGRLSQSVVDLDGAIIDYPRPKTGMPRRCPLWPETVAALREALAARPKPKRTEDAGLFFITKYGLSWHKDTPDSPIAKETAKLLKALGINGQKGRGFYTLRHTFRTVADEAKDQPAVDFIMGHEVPHMSAVYRETISDERLRAVSTHVRKWLFPSSALLAVAS